MLCKLKFFLFLSLFAFLALSATDVFAENKTQTFTLLPVDGEPQTVKIPIQISKTGTITATVKLAISGLLSEKTLYVSLHKKNNRYALKADYVSRMQGLHLRHKVDNRELVKGRDYYLSLTNYSRDKTLTGEVEISFPVAGEVETTVAGGPLPNIAVGKIFLDDRCKVQVTLKNLGPGPLPTYFWKMDMPEIKLFKDGQEWGGVDIRFFDYKQALSSVGGETVYNSGLKIIGSARIKAIVESGGRLREENKEDNSKEIVLTCE